MLTIIGYTTLHIYNVILGTQVEEERKQQRFEQWRREHKSVIDWSNVSYSTPGILPLDRGGQGFPLSDGHMGVYDYTKRTCYVE